MRKLAFPVGREAWLLLGLAFLVVLGIAAALHLMRPTALTIAVAPKGGPEPALLRAYADELARRKLGIRLTVSAFDGVRESAEALKTEGRPRGSPSGRLDAGERPYPSRLAKAGGVRCRPRAIRYQGFPGFGGQATRRAVEQDRR